MNKPDEDEPIRILVADDHTLLREAVCEMLRWELGLEVVAEAHDGASAVAMAERTQPDVVLLDIGMPGNQPALTVRRLKEIAPDAQIIVLSMYTDARLIQELLERGVRGYLHKGVSLEELAVTIRRVHCDRRHRVVSVALAEDQRADADSGLLSTREHEILTLVAQALSNRQIATRLAIAEGTVKRHLRNVFGKLGAVSRIDAVNKAVAASLIRPPTAARDAAGAQGTRGR